jgi:hypothetical protein
MSMSVKRLDEHEEALRATPSISTPQQGCKHSHQTAIYLYNTLSLTRYALHYLLKIKIKIKIQFLIYLKAPYIHTYIHTYVQKRGFKIKIETENTNTSTDSMSSYCTRTSTPAYVSHAERFGTGFPPGGK